jgi:hypothetical protein
MKCTLQRSELIEGETASAVGNSLMLLSEFMESFLFHPGLRTAHEPERVGVPEAEGIMTISQRDSPAPQWGGISPKKFAH